MDRWIGLGLILPTQFRLDLYCLDYYFEFRAAEPFPSGDDRLAVFGLEVMLHS